MFLHFCFMLNHQYQVFQQNIHNLLFSHSREFPINQTLDKLSLLLIFMKIPLNLQKFKRTTNNQNIQYPLQGSYSFRLEPAYHSQQKLQDTSTGLIASSDKLNSFNALSQLKSTEEHYEMIKKRMQVLKLKQQKNSNRYQLNHQKIFLRNSIQQLASIEKQRIRQWKEQNQELIQERKLINLQEKLIHHKNIQQIVENNQQYKLRQYEDRKQESKAHQNKIKEMEQESLQLNKKKVQNIKKLEDLSKLSIQSYNKQRLSQFRNKKLKQAMNLTDKKLQKQLQIKKMIQLESQMIERQSQSRIMFQKSTQKLKSILNPQNSNKKCKNRQMLFVEKYPQSPAVQNKNFCFFIDENEKSSNIQLNITMEEKNDESSTEYSNNQFQPIKNRFSLPEIKTARKYI